MTGASESIIVARGRPTDRVSTAGRFVLRELVGGLGDLGTFIPIVIGLCVIVGMDPATVLVFSGLMNLVTGAIFRVPIAVQPMKAIAALAIAGTLTAQQVGAAGLFVAACVLFLAAFGLIGVLGRVIPASVLGGVQVAVGAALVLKGITLAVVGPAGALRPLWGAEGLCMVALAVAVLVLLRRRWLAAAFGLLLLGAIGAVVKSPAVMTMGQITLWRPTLVAWDLGALTGVWRAGLGQLPLTLLNSVFAVSLLANRLFPGNGTRSTPRKIALSVGLMNLVACPFGGMPVCHGSGGLAAQHAFGARTGWSMIILGAVKLATGLWFGALALAWMQAFPHTVLGVFLLLAGVALARASRFWHGRSIAVVAIVTAGVTFATRALPIGFAAGWVTHAVICRKRTRNDDNVQA